MRQVPYNSPHLIKFMKLRSCHSINLYINVQRYRDCIIETRLLAPAVLLQVRPCAPVVGEASATSLGIHFKSLFTVRFPGAYDDWIWLNMIEDDWPKHSAVYQACPFWILYVTRASLMVHSSIFYATFRNLEAPRVERLWALRWAWHLPGFFASQVRKSVF